MVIMSFIQKFGSIRLMKTTNIFKPFSKYVHVTVARFSEKNVDIENMPTEKPNPYEKEKPKCVLCKHNIEPSYKNVRLLSQFVSRFTGRIYGRHITGLCKHKHGRVTTEIIKARRAGLMAYYFKDPNYFNDPSLYNESNPLRPHRFF